EKALDAGKPFVLTKVGRKAAGMRAAASHTGSLAGEDRVFDAVVRQAGILRARNEEHMLDVMAALVTNPVPSGRGIAIITQSGGAGVLMADRAEEIGLSVPVLAEATQAALRKVLPEFGAAANPIDVTGAFLADPRILTESVRIALEDPAVDVGVIWLQLMHGHADKLVELFRQIRREVAKPFLVCWLEAPERSRAALMADGIAVFAATERTIDAAKGLVDWGASLRRHRSRRQTSRPGAARHHTAAGAGGDVATVPSMVARDLLEAAGLRTVTTRLAADEASAVAAANELGYPVAIKVESTGIPHKTEADGVILGAKTPEDVARAVARVMAGARRHQPDATVDGVLVQRMAA
ncbi:MAG TPA: acetate--CoA ligase family protein, partial [Hyphomicrobiaceae bacterium]|nr:acetate--CoA ligase family protein [Hyphomicrobiaceae bacterium]